LIPPPEGLCSILPIPICPSDVVNAGAGLASSVAGQAASSVIETVASGLQHAADWLVGQVIDLIMRSAEPHMDAGWFGPEIALIEKVAVLVVLPVLMVASMGPVLRQDARRLLRVWAVGLPVAVFGGFVAAELTGVALGATDGITSLVAGSHSAGLGRQFVTAMTSSPALVAPVFVQIAIAGLTMVGALLVWLELMVRSAGVYVATFFMPLALVAYIWPATAGVAKRAVQILASLILSKFVIVACVSLGLAALAGGGVDAEVSGAGVLLMAAFAPFALLRLAPIVEASAIAHLEGMSRRPVRATARAATAAAGAPTHPITQLVMSARSRASGGEGDAGGLEPTLVAAQPLTFRAPDYPVPDDQVPDGGTPGRADG